MLTQYSINTTKEEALYDITSYVREAVKKSATFSGICIVFCLHTTGAITINENADKDVQTDIINGLSDIFPDKPYFKHMEGNSDAHMKSSCIGASETIIIENGTLMLGTWQGIYFCEFDGPRKRNFLVKIISD